MPQWYRVKDGTPTQQGELYWIIAKGECSFTPSLYLAKLVGGAIPGWQIFDGKGFSDCNRFNLQDVIAWTFLAVPDFPDMSTLTEPWYVGDCFKVIKEKGNKGQPIWIPCDINSTVGMVVEDEDKEANNQGEVMVEYYDSNHIRDRLSVPIETLAKISKEEFLSAIETFGFEREDVKI